MAPNFNVLNSKLIGSKRSKTGFLYFDLLFLLQYFQEIKDIKLVRNYQLIANHRNDKRFFWIFAAKLTLNKISFSYYVTIY